MSETVVVTMGRCCCSQWHRPVLLTSHDTAWQPSIASVQGPAGARPRHAEGWSAAPGPGVDSCRLLWRGAYRGAAAGAGMSK